MKPPKFPDTLPDGVTFDPLAPPPRIPLPKLNPVSARAIAAAGALLSASPQDSGADPSPPIDFTPVPRLRHRRAGWTPDRQRAFIAALARCGSVSAAARHVGMTPRTAYKLLDSAGAESFAAAWDTAIDQGFARLESDALERALHGSFVPVYRGGKLTRVEHRRNDRLAIAVLKSHDTRIDQFRASALSRCQHRADLRELDLLRDERAARLAEIEEQYRASAERLLDAVRDRIDQRAPRIFAL